MFKLSMVYIYSFKTYVYPLSGSSELKLHFSFTSLFVVAYQYDIYILYIVFCVCKSTKLIMWTNTCVTKPYKRREGLTSAFFMVNRFWWFWRIFYHHFVLEITWTKSFSIVTEKFQQSIVCVMIFFNVIKYNDQQWNG